MRTVFNGKTIADSKAVMLMIASPGALDHYFPLEDVEQSLLLPSGHTETSGYWGVKRFWHVSVGDKSAENAVWCYDPQENRPDFSGTIAFDWNQMERWYEEAEVVLYHPRNPYHRIATLPITA